MPNIKYISWNVRGLSQEHGENYALVNIRVRVSIADILRDFDLAGIMEVTLGNGEAACKAITDTMNSAVGSDDYACVVSERNIPVGHENMGRADKYCVIYKKNAVKFDSKPMLYEGETEFEDRVPLFWSLEGLADTHYFVLWHAPQENNHKRSETINLLAQAADEIMQAFHCGNMVIAGDFNFDTGNAGVYKPLTDKGFVGLLNGVLTTLAGDDSFRQGIDRLISEGKALQAVSEIQRMFVSNAFDNIYHHGIPVIRQGCFLLPWDIFTRHLPKYIGAAAIKLDDEGVAPCLLYSLSQAHTISDHLPVCAELDIK